MVDFYSNLSKKRLVCQSKEAQISFRLCCLFGFLIIQGETPTNSDFNHIMVYLKQTWRSVCVNATQVEER